MMLDLGNPQLSREISVLVSLVIGGTIPRLEELGLARECCDSTPVLWIMYFFVRGSRCQVASFAPKRSGM